MRHEDRVRLRGLGDLDAASDDEVVADHHFGNGGPRLGRMMKSTPMRHRHRCRRAANRRSCDTACRSVR